MHILPIVFQNVRGGCTKKSAQMLMRN